MGEGASTSAVLSQEDVLKSPLSSVGAKASTLARLAGEGIPVPDFFCLSSAAFALHLADNKVAWPESVNDRTDLAQVGAVRDEIVHAPVPKAVAEPALEAYDRLRLASGHGKVAVRSSGAEEDSPDASFAGQFGSTLGVDGPSDLLDAVKECWASFLSDRSMRYRASRNTPHGRVPRFAVIVQSQIFSRKAGVLFTAHPLEAGGDTSYIEANFGTGESVVGGLVTPDAITISRSSGKVVEFRVASKRRMTRVSLESPGSSVVDVEEGQMDSPVLTEPEARRIFELGLRIEKLMGATQDIEWAFDSDDLWVLQSRPLTGLG